MKAFNLPIMQVVASLAYANPSAIELLSNAVNVEMALWNISNHADACVVVVEKEPKTTPATYERLVHLPIPKYNELVGLVIPRAPWVSRG